MVRMVNTTAGGELMYLSGLGEALTSECLDCVSKEVCLTARTVVTGNTAGDEYSSTQRRWM